MTLLSILYKAKMNAFCGGDIFVNLLQEKPSYRETKRDRKTKEFQYKGGRGMPIAEDYKNVLLAFVF
jgi:hypothetical protein